MRLTGRRSLIITGVLSIVVLGVEFFTGPVIQFPILFIIPVSLAAWGAGRTAGLVFAIALPLARLLFAGAQEAPWVFAESVLNMVVRITVLGAFAVLVDRTARQERALSARVRTLETILPVCEICKRIKSDDENWDPLEEYVARHGSTVSQVLCPRCATEHYGETFDRR